MASCVHDIVQDGICTHCKSAVNTQRDAYIPVHYLKNGLEFRPEFVGTMKRHVWMKSLVEKKLTLVLALHDTLYDSRPVSLLSEKETYLTEESKKLSFDDMWRSENGKILYKLRPFAREFLREANKLFQMHVVEHSDPDRPKEVLSFLDPQGSYFGKRIITHRESEMKNLDMVLAEERGVVILDDKRLYWWPDNYTNLLQIRPYVYFKRCDDSNNSDSQSWIMKLVDLLLFRTTRHPPESSFAEERIDEDAEDGGLANALVLLKEVHRRFFTEGVEKDSTRDVRAFLFPLKRVS